MPFSLLSFGQLAAAAASQRMFCLVGRSKTRKDEEKDFESFCLLLYMLIRNESKFKIPFPRVIWTERARHLETINGKENRNKFRPKASCHHPWRKNFVYRRFSNIFKSNAVCIAFSKLYTFPKSMQQIHFRIFVVVAKKLFLPLLCDCMYVPTYTSRPPMCVFVFNKKSIQLTPIRV